MCNFIIRFISCFIFNQQKRKTFRQKWFDRVIALLQFPEISARLARQLDYVFVQLKTMNARFDAQLCGGGGVYRRAVR
ncbi:hypothetical protein FACS1894139_16060 [Planctomycetales bacterium]|nr:hypothetical protein FACS1894139_16060 [Planctomycetales bacterium]